MKLVRSILIRGVIGALVMVCVHVAAPRSLARPSAPPRVDVRIVTDEAEAVLAILAARESGRPVAEADWQRLFASEGYVRLKRREEAMKRTFTDAEFKDFVVSTEFAGARRESLTL